MSDKPAPPSNSTAAGAAPAAAGPSGPAVSPPDPSREPQARPPRRVAVTGASGFVGGYIVRELLGRGFDPVCLARDEERLLHRLPKGAEDRVEIVRGDLFNRRAMQRTLEGVDAAIHLVGIILETVRQSFRRVHVEGTRAMVDAAKETGVRRYIHMSALGSRPGAISTYHRTKYEAEEIVRGSGLDWTIFRPSVIHGPEGEFMRLMKAFSKPRPWHGPAVLGMPYFGGGQSKLQPVSVRDVAFCFVAAIDLPETIGQTYALGGPEVFTWKQLYTVCAQIIAGRPRRLMSVPVPVAKALALTVMKTPLVPKLLKFNTDQVQMAQEHSVCDTEPIERTFGIKLRDFRDELTSYAEEI